MQRDEGLMGAVCTLGWNRWGNKASSDGGTRRSNPEGREVVVGGTRRSNTKHNFRLENLAARAEHDQPHWEGGDVFSSGVNGGVLS